MPQVGLQTEYNFTLPKGYIDESGNLHRKGTMRLATALDEIAPLRDPRVKSNQAYLTIILLARVVTRLGELQDINTGVIESLFSADLAFLQAFYRRINEGDDTVIHTKCPHCGQEVEVDIGEAGGL